MRVRNSIPGAPFQAHLNRRVDNIHGLLRRGLILDSPDIVAQSLPDGRIQLRLRNPFGAQALPLVAPVPPTPLPGSGGAYTDFYTQSGGSNLNAGSDANNGALYTSTNGNWTQGTRVFIPTDGTNPVTAGVAVGMFASVYNDGAAVGVYIGRISAVVNAVNGSITIDVTANAGAAPTTSATARTIKVGGAFKGPNAASGYPVTLASLGRLVDASSHPFRLNLKNDAVYSMTAGFTFSSAINPCTFQGYSSVIGDGGKAVFDAGTNNITILISSGIDVHWIDMEFKAAATSGSAILVQSTNLATQFLRCVFHGARGPGLSLAGAAIECEAYNCNRSNTNPGGFVVSTAGSILSRCYSHDHSGNTSHGVLMSAAGSAFHCVIENCGGNGINITSFGLAGIISNCDLYNNTGDGIQLTSGLNAAMIFIENCNFIKNGGSGINNATTTAYFVLGHIYNCGYGVGSMANGSGDVLGSLQKFSAINYSTGTTPWSSPDAGNFTITGATAIGTGRGSFTETDGTNSGTVGTPNIGAA